MPDLCDGGGLALARVVGDLADDEPPLGERRGHRCRQALSVGRVVDVDRGVLGPDRLGVERGTRGSRRPGRDRLGLGLVVRPRVPEREEQAEQHDTCLLYTSDAADERSSVDLGGSRII